MNTETLTFRSNRQEDEEESLYKSPFQNRLSVNFMI